MQRWRKKNRLGATDLCRDQINQYEKKLDARVEPVWITPLHHLMIGTWTRPGAIFTVQFDPTKQTLKLVKKTEISHGEAISWMTLSVTSS